MTVAVSCITYAVPNSALCPGYSWQFCLATHSARTGYSLCSSLQPSSTGPYAVSSFKFYSRARRLSASSDRHARYGIRKGRDVTSYIGLLKSRRPTALQALANQAPPISGLKRSDAESAGYIKRLFASIAGARADNLDDTAGCLDLSCFAISLLLYLYFFGSVLPIYTLCAMRASAAVLALAAAVPGKCEIQPWIDYSV